MTLTSMIIAILIFTGVCALFLGAQFVYYKLRNRRKHREFCECVDRMFPTEEEINERR